MVREHEIVTLLLGVGVLVFFVAVRRWLRGFPEARLFVGAFVAYVVAWVFTILEGRWGDSSTAEAIYTGCNLAEHIGYLVGAVLFLLWVRRLCRISEGDGA